MGKLMNTPAKNNVEIQITNISTKKDGFAVVSDTREAVYIPPSVTKASDIIPGELRRATLIENDPDKRTSTKFKAVFVENFTGQQGQSAYNLARIYKADPDIEARILKILRVAEPYFTTGEIAYDLDVENDIARDVLNRMFENGRVAKAEVFHQPNKHPVSVLWAIEPDDFI